MKNAILWKRILHEKLRDPAKSTRGISSLSWFENKIITSPIIVDTRPPGEIYGSSFDWGNFRTMTFPFPEMWVECRDSQEQYSGSFISANRQNDAIYIEALLVVSNHTLRPSILACVRFVVTMEGDLILVEGDRFPCSVANVENITSYYSGTKDEYENSILSHVHNFLEVMMLLGCKNVEISPCDNDPRQVRIATKRHGPSATGYRYHVLTVRPAGSKPGTPGEEIGNMPRHVCRGHFAEYGPQYGKGRLFGKYAGRFYVPPCMKGDKKNGTVLKDYQVVGAV